MRAQAGGGVDEKLEGSKPSGRKPAGRQASSNAGQASANRPQARILFSGTTWRLAMEARDLAVTAAEEYPEYNS